MKFRIPATLSTTSCLALAVAISTIAFTSELRSECPPVYTFRGETPNDRFGNKVDDAGDVDNDGYSDLIVAAQYYDPADSSMGRVYIYSGFDGSLIHTFTGEKIRQRLGSSAAGVGDIDGDGYDDILIGAIGCDSMGNYSGCAFLFSGKDASLLGSYYGDSGYDIFGSAVDGLGDVNGDGVPDFVIGAPQATPNGFNSGSAYVYSGKTGLRLWTFYGEAPFDNLGNSVAGLGDVDNDGFADIGVSAPQHDGNAKNSGRVYIYSGQSGLPIHILDGDLEEETMGVAVAGLGDINGDFHADIAVSLNYPFPGRVDVYSGLDGSVIHSIVGSPVSRFFGSSISGGLDFNLDGVPDIVIGSNNKDVANGAGRVYVYDGQSGELYYSVATGPATDVFGFSVAAVRSSSPVGRPSLLISAILSDFSGTDAGAAYVFANCCCDRPGDANNDGSVVISDAVYLVNYIFANGDSPGCLDEGDTNGSNSIDIGDAIHIVLRIFGGLSPLVCGTQGY